MTTSEMPPFMVRNTSSTTRARFTPARSWSTWTRTAATFRLVRFSAAVSFPRLGFFFRLAGFLHCWLITLEATIFIQGSLWRVGNPLRIGDLFLMRLARMCLAQVVNPLTPSVDEDHVLVAMLLLTSTVVKGLFFRVFRPLATPFRAVDDEPRVRLGRGLGLGKALGVALGADTEVVQSRLHDGQQALNPVVHAGLTEVEEFGHDGLEGVGLEIDQQKQQFLFGQMQGALTAASGRSLAG